MNSATLPKPYSSSLVPLRTVPPTFLPYKVSAIRRQAFLAIEVALFWALVLVLSGFCWLGSGIWEGIEILIGFSKPGASVTPAHRTEAGGQITVNLVIVLAVITAAVGALAYEWHHVQAAKTHQRPLVAHHM